MVTLKKLKSTITDQDFLTVQVQSFYLGFAFALLILFGHKVNSIEPIGLMLTIIGLVMILWGVFYWIKSRPRYMKYLGPSCWVGICAWFFLLIQTNPFYEVTTSESAMPFLITAMLVYATLQIVYFWLIKDKKELPFRKVLTQFNAGTLTIAVLVIDLAILEFAYRLGISDEAFSWLIVFSVPLILGLFSIPILNIKELTLQKNL